MKHRLSISVDETTIETIRTLLRTGKFRNKSHAVEHAILNYTQHDKNSN